MKEASAQWQCGQEGGHGGEDGEVRRLRLSPKIGGECEREAENNVGDGGGFRAGGHAGCSRQRT